MSRATSSPRFTGAATVSREAARTTPAAFSRATGAAVFTGRSGTVPPVILTVVVTMRSG